LTPVRLVPPDGRSCAQCTVHGSSKRHLHALVDPGSSHTVARKDICANLDLKNAGDLVVACVHASHADVVTQRRFCTVTLGTMPRRLAVSELGRTDEGGRHLEAILGLDMPEGCRMALDWRRMEGVPEA